MSIKKKDVGMRIRVARKLNNYTQESLAELVDTDRKTISRIERGKTLPEMKSMA